MQTNTPKDHIIMTGMFDDVLTIGQLEVEKLECGLTSFNLVEYSRQSPEEVQMNLGYWRLIFVTSQYKSVTCCMDGKLLGHILTNLFSNMIKYFPDDSIFNFNLLCPDAQVGFEIQCMRICIYQKDVQCRLLELFYSAINVVIILGTRLKITIKKLIDIIYKSKINFTSIFDVYNKDNYIFY